MIRLISKPVLLITVTILMACGTFGATAYAATDTYINYSSLSANEVYGVDYKIETKDTGSTSVIMAIHGGRIEKGTTELAKAISDLGAFSYYSFIGMKASDNASLHITSSNFDEKTARDLAAKSKFSVSIHGAAGTDKVTYLGGLDTALGKQIQKSLSAAGFIVKPAPAGMQGTEKLNITNTTLSGKGVQLELTRGLRDSFFTSTGASSPTLVKYSEAVNKGIKIYTSGKV